VVNTSELKTVSTALVALSTNFHQLS